MAIDGDVKPVLDYRVGVKARWFLPGDLIVLVETLISGRKKVRDLLSFLKFYERGMVYDELSLDDLNAIPGLLLQLLGQFLEPRGMQRYVLRSSTANGVVSE